MMCSQPRPGIDHGAEASLRCRHSTFLGQTIGWRRPLGCIPHAGTPAVAESLAGFGLEAPPWTGRGRRRRRRQHPPTQQSASKRAAGGLLPPDLDHSWQQRYIRKRNRTGSRVGADPCVASGGFCYF